MWHDFYRWTILCQYSEIILGGLFRLGRSLHLNHDIGHRILSERHESSHLGHTSMLLRWRLCGKGVLSTIEHSSSLKLNILLRTSLPPPFCSTPDPSSPNHPSSYSSTRFSPFKRPCVTPSGLVRLLTSSSTVPALPRLSTTSRLASASLGPLSLMDGPLYPSNGGRLNQLLSFSWISTSSSFRCPIYGS
jgi:hypothetical protein